MNPASGQSDTTQTSKRVQQIGCVGYLNAKPLIEGLANATGSALPRAQVRLDVPSNLLEGLETGDFDIALCPVIDYYRSDKPLVIVPSGCIASDGPAQTVRLFSRVPIASIATVHADNDSHTSIVLLRVLLDRLHKSHPKIVPFDAHHRASAPQTNQPPEAMLLIGDKVVNDAPSSIEYPHQMDLGEAWKEVTGLPFVFAIWMARLGDDLKDLPWLLDRQRGCNTVGIDAIAGMYASSYGWERDAAKRYLGQVLRYQAGPKQIESIERFAQEAAQLGVISQARPLRMYGQAI